MTTTVKRLRIAARHDESQGRMMSQAADLIEQQQREIEELRSEILIKSRTIKAQAKICQLAHEECDEWKHKKFAGFADDECWIFSDDGYDNLHSLACPVVMSKDKAIELIEKRDSRYKEVIRDFAESLVELGNVPHLMGAGETDSYFECGDILQYADEYTKRFKV